MVFNFIYLFNFFSIKNFNLLYNKIFNKNLLIIFWFITTFFFFESTLKREIFLPVGALTSKIFMFKARNWELTNSVSIDLTDAFFEKIWIDFKNNEIFWILPWIQNYNKETWISDKVWFSYDGLNWNWIIKIFYKNNILLFGFGLALLCVSDNLYNKYIHYFFLKKNGINIYYFFKNEIIFFYYFLYEIYLKFNSILYFYKNINNFYKKLEISYININCILLTFAWKELTLKNIFKLNSCITTFFFTRKKKYLIKNYFKIYNFLSTKNFYNKILFNFSWKNFLLKLNFFFTSTLDISKISFFQFMENTYNLIKLSSTNYFYNSKATLLFSSIFLKNQIFDFFFDINNLWNFDFILIAGLNIRIVSPKLHITLWKLFKKKNSIKFFLFGNIDNLLFLNLNFGFNFLQFKLFFDGKHWVNFFFIKSNSTVFFFGKEIFFFKKKLIENYLYSFFYFFNYKWIKFQFKLNYFKKYIHMLPFDLSIFFIDNLMWNTSFIPILKVKKKILNEKFKINNFKFFIGSKISIFSGISTLKFIYSNKNYSKQLLLLMDYAILDFCKEPNIILPIFSFIEICAHWLTSKLELFRSIKLKFNLWQTNFELVFLILFKSCFVFPFLWVLQIKFFFHSFFILITRFWLFGFLKIWIKQKNKFFCLNTNIFYTKINKFFFWKIYMKFFVVFDINIFNFWNSDLTFILNSKYFLVTNLFFFKINRTFTRSLP